MNHDSAHCADCAKDCPKDFYRAQLTKELRKEKYPFPVSFAHFKNTEECPLREIVLKNCPCCGGEAKFHGCQKFDEELQIPVNTHEWGVHCTECGLITQPCETKIIAAEMWNKRTYTKECKNCPAQCIGDEICEECKERFNYDKD